MDTVGTIRLDGGRWHIKTKPHVAMRLRSVFGQMKGQYGELSIKDTPEVCRELRWFCERYPHEIDALDHLNAQADEHERLDNVAADLLTGRVAPRPFAMKLPPRPYQAIACELGLQTKGLLIADDLGLGKTVMGLGIIADVSARPALVVCAPHLQRQWRREVEKFLPGMQVHILQKSTPYDIVGAQTKGRRQMRLLEPRFPDVIISSYHKLHGWAEVISPKIKAVVWDEVQELRRTTSSKYAAAKHIADNVDIRVGLSATPVYNHGDEMHAVMECIRPGALGDEFEFRRTWCKEDKGVKEPKAFGAYLREAGLMIRRTRKDVARELPALSICHHEVDADPSALNKIAIAAAELARTILAENTSFELRGQSSRELDVKLRQAVGIAKAPHVAEFVRMLCESGEKVVVFGWHREVYRIWMEMLDEFRPVMFTGSESAAAKDRARTEFIEGDAQILIMSLRSGAGLDGLQHVCRTVVFGELDWSPGVHTQAAGRVHRDGQTDPVVAYYLTADAGADPIMLDVLGVKEAQAEGIRNPEGVEVEVLDTTAKARMREVAEAYLAGLGRGRRAA